METLYLQCSGEAKDYLIAELWERGTRGIIERDLSETRYELQAFFEARFPAEDFTAHEPRWERADETNWVRIIMETWQPVLAGQRFFIVADWRDDPTPPGRLRLQVHPGIALGTGEHPTTQMCLEAMERHLGAGEHFLDLGTGSGILAQAAWLLGERRIIASDIDPQATGAAAENLTRAGVPVLLFTGSTQAVIDEAADFVAANISAEAVIDAATELHRVLVPGGCAVVSGFAPERSAEVRQAVEGAGLSFLSGDERDGWACLVFQKVGGKGIESR